MLVGRQILKTTGGGGNEPITVNFSGPSLGGGFMGIYISTNLGNDSQAWPGGAQFLYVGVSIGYQFSTNQAQSTNELIGMTNMGIDGGYRYRWRRLSGDNPDTGMLENAPIGTYQSYFGGTVEPNRSDNVGGWNLFSPGTKTASCEIEIWNPNEFDGGSAIYNRVVNVSCTRTS